MTPDHWRKIEECYHEALGREPASRAAYLAQLDPGIRAEVGELLAQESQDSPLDHRSGLFESLTPGAMLGHYRIDQSIGAGGMGEVYRATDTKLSRSVAIKVCGAGFVRRFEREARAIAALNHPNICTLYESGPDYLVMELVEGPTLADSIRKSAIPINEAIDIARQIAEALEAAHEHGIIHRDLKPANIKLTTDGRVKVLDFGLAKSTAPTPPDAAAATITNTEQGLIVGTPSYMSPEQAEGLPTDKRADIWSFGVVLWEMLTGHRLFDAQSASRILSEVLQREIDFDKLPAAVPDHIRALLRRCLDRNLKTRLRDIGEARVALSGDPNPESTRRPGHSPIKTLVWTAVTCALAVAVIWSNVGSQTPQSLNSSLQRSIFQFPAPESDFEDLSISPNGQHVLMFGGSRTPVKKLWLRSVDSLETKLLTSIDGLVWATWSPDSESLLYQAGTHLYRIARNGSSSATLITEVPASLGDGLWLDSQTIILMGRHGIFRLTLPGTTLSKLYEQPGFNPLRLVDQSFTFQGSDGLYVGWLNGRKPVRISADRGNMAHVYVPPASSSKPVGAGHLFLLRDGVLQVQLFDPAKLEFQGAPIPLTDLPGGAAMYAASPNGVLVICVHPTKKNLAWSDRNGKVLTRVTPDVNLSAMHFRLSPDETRAALTLRASDRKSDVWIADLQNATLSRLTFTGNAKGGAVWSPDSRSVVWTAQNGDRFLRSSDGSGPDVLLFNLPDSVLTDWSLTGKWIASHHFSEQRRWEVWLSPAADGFDNSARDHKASPFLQGDLHYYDGAFSPDGRWIAHTAALEQTLAPQVFVESIPRGAGRWQASIEGGNRPTWRRDGKELFFLHRGKLMGVSVKPKPSSTLEFGKPQPLFDLPPGSHYQVTRDGQRFLVALPAQPDGPPPPLMITVDTDWRAGLTSKQP